MESSNDEVLRCTAIYTIVIYYRILSALSAGGFQVCHCFRLYSGLFVHSFCVLLSCQVSLAFMLLFWLGQLAACMNVNVGLGSVFSIFQRQSQQVSEDFYEELIKLLYCYVITTCPWLLCVVCIPCLLLYVEEDTQCPVRWCFSE